MICGSCKAELPQGVSACPACGSHAFNASDTALETRVPGLRESLLVAERFRLVRKLGRGGMGEVWLADDTLLEQPVALKMLRPELMGDAKSIAALRKEVLIARDLQHPNIVRIHDIHREGELYFISMEYVDGHSLADALAHRGKPFTLDELQPLLKAAAKAIDYAHTKNVLHRDIKPANFLLGNDGTVKLTDFGIARAAKDTITRVTGEATSGTLLYMSPEQLLGETDKIGPRSDVYSFAVTVYELLSGEPPFHTGKIDLQILTKTPGRIAGLIECENDGLARGLAKETSDRPATGVELLRALFGAPPAGVARAEPVTRATPSRSPGDARTFAGIEMVWIPPGTFSMGSPTSESGHRDDETQHEVTLTQGFWMGKYQVTQSQWEAVMGSNPSQLKGGDHPVEQVSWDDCQTFLENLSARGDGTFRLPTEAEWEYACRAGTSEAYSFGNDPGQLGSYGWYLDNSVRVTHPGGLLNTVRKIWDSTEGRGTQPVGQLSPNAWGLHDMHGNVWEWCADWYGAYPSGPVTDSKGPATGEFRVLRGGSWHLDSSFCRSAHRNANPPDYLDADDGFRVVRTE